MAAKANNFRRLGRTKKHRKALFRNLVTSLITHERIVTTVAKAKEVQGLAERLITYAKKEDKLHGRRLAQKHLFTKDAGSKLMSVLGPRYEFRDGGYTRIMKLSKPRRGDKSDMAVLEYVDRPGEIRAARPPSYFQDKTIEEVMEELGIEDPVQKEREEVVEGDVVEKE